MKAQATIQSDQDYIITSNSDMTRLTPYTSLLTPHIIYVHRVGRKVLDAE